MTAILTPHMLVLIAAAITVAYAAQSDLRHYRIPNECSLLLLALYPLHIWSSPASVDVIAALMVGGIIFVAGFALYALGRFGGGDVKLMSVLALWAGPAFIGDFLIIMSLTGGVLAIAFITRLKMVMAFAFEQIGDVQARDAVLAEKLPYGLAIAAGGCAVLIQLAA
tara:strand:- start:350 stop:850 length:501 start_codon:yes stop_codon:yes gene_type:complete